MNKLYDLFATRRKVLAALIAGLILSFMLLMAVCSSIGAFGDPGDSAIVDEIAHIPAGYTYVKDQDFRLNPEHPPLAKALAALPLALNSNIVGPESDKSWGEINQWEAGWAMLYKMGNNPSQVLFWSRLMLMLLMIGLGVFLYKWVSQLFGKKVGLIVLLLYAFYPDILAHGRLVTTDVAAAFGYVIAIYFFDKALQQKTWKAVMFAALAFALAQLLKFSAFLLFLIFLVLVVVKAIMDRKEDEGFWHSFKLNFKPYFLTCIISLLIVWAVYIPFTYHTPPAIEHQLIENNLTQDPRTLPLRNFLHGFENGAVTRGLGHYFLGVMMVIGRVGGGNVTYIMGHFSDKSIPWYFPVAWFLKTPIPIILLSFSSFFYLLFRWPAKKEDKWTIALFVTPLIVYWAVTLKGSLNIGIRHLMPTIPFVLIMIGYFISKVWNNKKNLFKILISLALVYMVASTLYNYPNFIAYFNEATPKDIRYTRLDDSSLDWGQDMLRLKKYFADNNLKYVKVDYFGGALPSYYIPDAINWHASYGPTTGMLAISATYYQSSKIFGPKEGIWSYEWLDSYKPKAIIGGSILIFDITPQDLKNNPPRSKYPVTHVDVLPTIKK
ncbi:MAG: glycosyltransferase family 39 protein [Candidatus Berkelbacteria bacterium]